jgi:type IX secretion system PorP/SprF family membrane protein
MLHKIFILSILCFALCNQAQAQQDPLYSQYMFNMLGVNPAYAGSRELLSITAMGRSQWTGMKGAPSSQLLTADFSVKEKKVGLGLQVFNDKIGVTKTTGINLSYAYRLQFKRGTFSMGLQGGIAAFKANFSELQLSTTDVNDVAFATNLNEVKPTVGAGVYYTTDKFYVGFSAPHLLHLKSRYSSTTGDNSMYENNHWMLAAGYVYHFSPDVVLKPSVLLRMVSGAPINIDVNANVWFYNIVALGVSVRTSHMVVGMLEIQANRQFRFGYAYDYTTSGLTSRGSHELMLRYEFGYEKKHMYSPRYF